MLIDNNPLLTTDRCIKLTNDFAINLLVDCNGSSPAILKPVRSNYGFRIYCIPNWSIWAAKRSLQNFLWWFSSLENTVLWIDTTIKMEVGLITEPNIVNPVVVSFHLVIKSITHFYSSLFILCSQFLFPSNAIWKKFQIQFQYKDCAHPAKTQPLIAWSTRFFWTLSSNKWTAAMFCWVLAPLVQPDLPLMLLWTVLSVWNFFAILHIIFLEEFF